jgi:hypothetical protein
MTSSTLEGENKNTLKHTKRSTHNLSQHSKDYDERVIASYLCEDALWNSD